MRLALATGRLDVDAVLAGLNARQMAEWEAFERLEGSFGDRGAWIRMAHMLSFYAEAHRDAKKRSQSFKVTEFLPWVERPADVPSRRLRSWDTC